MELTQEQALNLLVNAVRVATKRGAFEIEETENILKAIKVFTTKPEISIEEIKEKED
jgi:hypothetical protein